jgi:hypothetical protein
VTGWDSLKPHSIGIMAGMREAEDGMCRLNVDAVPSPVVIMQKLELCRTDIVVLPLVDMKEQRRYSAELKAEEGSRFHCPGGLGGLGPLQGLTSGAPGRPGAIRPPDCFGMS